MTRSRNFPQMSDSASFRPVPHSRIRDEFPCLPDDLTPPEDWKLVWAEAILKGAFVAASAFFCIFTFGYLLYAMLLTAGVH